METLLLSEKNSEFRKKHLPIMQPKADFVMLQLFRQYRFNFDVFCEITELKALFYK